MWLEGCCEVCNCGFCEREWAPNILHLVTIYAVCKLALETLQNNKGRKSVPVFRADRTWPPFQDHNVWASEFSPGGDLILRRPGGWSGGETIVTTRGPPPSIPTMGAQPGNDKGRLARGRKSPAGPSAASLGPGGDGWGTGPASLAKRIEFEPQNSLLL